MYYGPWVYRCFKYRRTCYVCLAIRAAWYWLFGSGVIENPTHSAYGSMYLDALRLALLSSPYSADPEAYVSLLGALMKACPRV